MKLNKLHLLFTLVLLPVFVISCKNTATLTVKEKEAIDNTLAFYGGGNYSWKKRMFWGNKNDKNTFEFELSNSPNIEVFAEDKALFASGIAYRLYSLMGEDHDKYNIFKIGLKNGNELSQFEYTTKNIKDIEPFIITSDLCVAEIKTKRYQDFYKRFEKQDTRYQLMSLDDSKDFCNSVDSLMGDIQNNWFLGYEYNTPVSDEDTVIRITSMLESKAGTAGLSIMMKKKTQKIVGLQFN